MKPIQSTDNANKKIVAAKADSSAGKATAKGQAKAQTGVPGRRFRPLGLSIAILATAGLYGLWQLVPVILLLLTRLRGHELSSELLDTGGWLSAGLAIVTLLACVAAWIGRPSQTRRILLVLVWVQTVLRIVNITQASQPGPLTSTTEIGGNLSTVMQPVNLCSIPLLILVPLYITWYMNRAPARAFYTRESAPPGGKNR